eukprot:jgi/Botrbrau1/3383/Bobra.0337s0024.1
MEYHVHSSLPSPSKSFPSYSPLIPPALLHFILILRSLSAVSLFYGLMGPSKGCVNRILLTCIEKRRPIGESFTVAAQPTGP